MPIANDTDLQSENRSTDLIVGISDGLLIPFAVCAGISRVAQEHTTVLVIGIIAAAIGGIAMGLARYFAGRSEMVHLHEPDPEELRLHEDAHKTIAQGIKEDNERWNNYLREHGMVIDQDIQSASVSATYIGIFYFMGGLIPLVPYIFFTNNYDGFIGSCIVALISLFIFGFMKGKYTETGSFLTGLRMSIVGVLLAAAAYMVAGVFA
jgi:VIT1/CCC1 family predicted Fe2+/Mn2+ transporter